MVLSDTIISKEVSTHSRPKAAGYLKPPTGANGKMFQHTAARRRLAAIKEIDKKTCNVSTHSRPKAAGYRLMKIRKAKRCFNTQPPEGGWVLPTARIAVNGSFNTQPPEGGWPTRRLHAQETQVSTHSRPKAAGWHKPLISTVDNSFNTQPPEGGWAMKTATCFLHVLFQHTAARRRLGLSVAKLKRAFAFQHTAARRRLGFII